MRTTMHSRRSLQQLTPPPLAPPVDLGRCRRGGSRQHCRAGRLCLITGGGRCQAGGCAVLASCGGGSRGAVLGSSRIPGVQASHTLGHGAGAPRLAQLNGAQVVLSKVGACARGRSGWCVHAQVDCNQPEGQSAKAVQVLTIPLAQPRGSPTSHCPSLPPCTPLPSRTAQLLQVNLLPRSEHGVGKVVERQAARHVERKPANHERQHPVVNGAWARWRSEWWSTQHFATSL